MEEGRKFGQWNVSSRYRCRYVRAVGTELVRCALDVVSVQRVRWCCGKLVRCTLDIVRVEVLGGAVGNW